MEKAKDVVSQVLEAFEREMPAVVLRSDPRIKNWCGISPGRLANLDSEGKGPRHKVLIGRVAGYPKGSLLEWISGRLKAA